MSRSQAMKALRDRGLLEHGPNLLYDSDDKVKAVIDGKSVAAMGHVPIRAGTRKEALAESLGSPLGTEPGLQGCGFDPTMCWLYPVKRGGLRIYIYGDSHDQIEIPREQRSTIVAVDLADSLHGSYRGGP
jgi:hypothetical protein